jgi:hypothetical protein
MRGYRGRIVRQSAAAEAAAADDDDDWMVCPITCEVISDAAATKVQHSLPHVYVATRTT